MMKTQKIPAVFLNIKYVNLSLILFRSRVTHMVETEASKQMGKNKETAHSSMTPNTNGLDRF